MFYRFMYQSQSEHSRLAPQKKTFLKKLLGPFLGIGFYCHCLKDTELLRGESHINLRTQCVIMTQTRWSPTPCHLRHSENFDKIDSFLKPVWNIYILGNLIVGCVMKVGELLKRKLVFCIKSLDLMEVLIFGVVFIKA